MPDGRWRGALDLGWQSGKRVRKVVTAKTRAEALAKLREVQRAAAQGVQADGRMTVGAWLSHWLKTVVEGRVSSPNTRKNYETLVRVHLVPALGKVLLTKLTPEDVDRFLQSKADAGLSRSTVGRLKVLLADALRHAERRGYVSRNAGQLAVMPRTEAPTQRQSLTPAQAGPSWKRHAANASRLSSSWPALVG